MSGSASAEGPRNAPGLRRVLGLTEVTAGGIGIIIGAGIYVLVGEAAAITGPGVWLAFAVAAALSFLTALSYMELTSMFPSAAGEYEYTRQAFPEPIAFVVGWIMVFGLVVAAAAIALGFASYVRYFADIDRRLTACALLLGVGLIAANGIKDSARLTIALSAVQVGGLLLVVVIGATHLGKHDVLAVNGAGSLLAGSALVFFAFIGFDEVITLSEETENPTRTVPLALALALALSTALYMAVAIGAVSVLGAEALGQSERPLADVIAHAVGSRGGQVMAALAVISTTNTCLLAVTAASRLLYGMAAGRSLPRPLAYLHPVRRTPLISIGITLLVAALFVQLGDLKLVASTTDFAVYVVFLAVNATVVLLRLTRPESARPFRVPFGFRKLPVLPLLAFAAVLVMMAFLDVAALGLGLLLVVAGFAVHSVLHLLKVSTV